MALIALLLLFMVTNAAYLHRVPGLLGDEGSEGMNVVELLRREGITIQGERSYIGVGMDYVRVPFVELFGHSILALRVPMLLASLATFWLAWLVFRKLFGDYAGLLALAAMVFSPAYWTFQRLGWAITLIPFFAFLTLAFLLSERRHAPLLAGLVAGLGLQNHIMFLPTLTGIVATFLLASWRWTTLREALKRGVAWWPALIGFWASFGVQFAVLQTFRDDQGDPAAVASLFWERLMDLPRVLPLVLSGSSFVANYTGREFSAATSSVISLALVVLALSALVFSSARRAAWWWALGLGIHLVALTVLMEYFALRYFVVVVLGVWVLAGVGLAAITARVFRRVPRFLQVLPVIVALLLATHTIFGILVPFLETGGSTNDFSLGNRTDTAAHLVALRPLQTCLASIGPVFSEDIHIRNRLEYLALRDPALSTAKNLRSTVWIVTHRRQDTPRRPDERCPDLRHFRVVPAGDRAKENS